MKIIKTIIFILFISFILVSGLLAVNGYNMYSKAIENVSLTDKVDEIRLKNNYTHLEDLPKIYINAVIAVEDHRFYSHGGFDIIAIGRALYNDVIAGSFVEGGSTITQQLAKNLYFTQEKEVTRKIAEIFMAIYIEDNYSKEEILELYLNSIYFGDYNYSVYDASMGYFGKPPIEMSDYECTLLAGIPNAPSAYSPSTDIELAEQRQKHVIKQMIKYGYLEE